MSIFDWETGRKKGEVVSAKWLGVFFAISGILTLLVLLIWAWWHKRSKKSSSTKDAGKFV